MPKFLEDKNNQKKLFAGVLCHELMEYLMIRYVNTTEPIKEQVKSEFRDEYNPNLPISKHFKRIEDYMQLAEDVNFPLQPEQILHQTYGQMKKCGI